MAGKRPTAVRDRRRAVIGRGHPPCALCGGPIDYALVYPDPGAFVVDDIVPLARGGEYTIANGQAAHSLCNRLKSDKLIAPVLKRSGSLVRPLGG